MIALRNLLRNRIRNLLTLLGVAAGISVFVTSYTVSSGFRQEITDILKRHSIEITVQARGAATPLVSRIDTRDYRRLSTVEGVAEVSSLALGSVRTHWNPYFVIAGISSGEALLNKFAPVEGRVLTPGRREIIIGKIAAVQLQCRVGSKVLLLDNEMFTVAGIYSVGSRIMDSGAILDMGDAQRLLRTDRQVNMAFVQTKPGSDPRQVIERINKLLPSLSALPSADFTGQVRMFNTVNIFARAISTIALFTCFIVVMNTLVMAISERTKEIGILMAVGWSRGMICRTILTEAVVLCLAGGIAGNGLGLVLLLALNWTNAAGLGWLPVAIPMQIVAQSMGLSACLGLLSSAYPAFVASRFQPAEALRYE